MLPANILQANVPAVPDLPAPAPVFQAPWPRSLDPANRSWKDRAVDIAIFALKIILLPAYVGYLVLRKIAAHVLLPSAYLTSTERPEDKIRRRGMVDATIRHMQHPQSRERAERCTFKTSDGVQLDGLFVRSRNDHPATRKVVLFACPNGACFEQMHQLILASFRGNGGLIGRPQRQQRPNPFANLFGQGPQQQSRHPGVHTLSSLPQAQGASRRSNVHTLSDLQRQEDNPMQGQQGLGQLFGALNALADVTGQLWECLEERASRPSFVPGFEEPFNMPDLMQGHALNPDVSVFFFNYRGVGDSQGISSLDKAPLDVYAAYKYLIDKYELAAEEIAFCGYSMGGAVAPIGAALVQDDYPEANLGGVSLCSFAELSTTAESVISRNIGFMPDLLGKAAKYAIRFFGLDLKTAESWERLRGPKRAYNQRNDMVIPCETSLAQRTNGTIGPGVNHFIPPGQLTGFTELRAALEL